MKNWFRIDYLKLVRLLLPFILRKPRIEAFVEACISPVDALYTHFLSFRYDNLYHLSITPQVYSLEKALNDRFDYTQRRIYITQGIRRELTYIYTQGENLDEYIGIDNENNDMYLYAGSESGENSASFIINVLSAIFFNEAEMRAMVEMYTVKSFKINII